MIIWLSIILGIGFLLALVMVFVFENHKKEWISYTFLVMFTILVLLCVSSLPSCELISINKYFVNDQTYLMREYYCKVLLTGYEGLHQDILLLNLDNITQDIEREK